MTRTGLPVLLLLAALLAGCGAREIRVVKPAPPARSLEGPARWVGFDEARRRAASDTEAAAFVQALGNEGWKTLFIQTKAASGDLLFPGPVAAPDDNAQRALGKLIAAARAQEIATVAVYPLLLGEPEAGEEPRVLRIFDDRVQVVQHEAPANAPRLNPFEPAVLLAERANLAELARFTPDAFCISHAELADPGAGFSLQARAAFERWMRAQSPDWPDAVMMRSPAGGIVPGPLYETWQTWRTEAVRAYVQNTRAALGPSKRPVLLMANGYFPLSLRSGLNWSVQNPPGEPPRDAGALVDLSRTAPVMDDFDGFVAELLIPVASTGEASKLGLAEWSSVEGALAAMAEALPPRRVDFVAISEGAWAGADGVLRETETDRLSAARAVIDSKGFPVLVLDQASSPVTF